MKYVAFIETNASGTGAEAIRKLQDSGYKVLFLTKEPEFYQSLEMNPPEMADKVIEVDTTCVASIINALKHYPLQGVVAFDDYRLVTAAFIAQYFQLPHPNIKGLINCRFKNLTRETVSSGNVRYWTGEIDQDVNLDEVCYPCVAKPCDDSGSVGVHICHDKASLRQAIEVIRKNRVNARGYALSSQYLIEEFIDGQEYSAELIWSIQKSEWLFLGFTKKTIAAGAHPVETGHDFPVQLDDQMRIENKILDWLSEAKLSKTVAHVEFKISSRGISLIEINPRPGGGMIHELCRLSTGVDVVERYLELLVTGYRSPLHETAYSAASIRFLIPETYGEMVQIKLPKNKPDGIIMVKVKDEPQTIQSLASSYDRLGFVISAGQIIQESQHLAENFIKKTVIEMKG